LQQRCSVEEDALKRIVFAEGEEIRVLQAVQQLVDEQRIFPILIGRPDIIERRWSMLGLRFDLKKDIEIVDPGHDLRYENYWKCYHSLVGRRGITPSDAKNLLRTNSTIIAALMVHKHDADGLICGTVGRYADHFRPILQILGVNKNASLCASLCALIMDQGPLFFCDPYLNVDPSADELKEMTLMAAKEVERFGIAPKIAFVSHSNFGTSKLPSASKMQHAIDALHQLHPDLEVDGEMHVDAALCEDIRKKIFLHSRLSGSANLLIFPNIESANIAFNMAKTLGDGFVVGPILMGLSVPTHILTTETTVQGIVNMASLAAS
jgi:malate dehydrogenase (oxaloacetate-decarboxylating)(NADP+)